MRDWSVSATAQGPKRNTSQRSQRPAALAGTVQRSRIVTTWNLLCRSVSLHALLPQVTPSYGPDRAFDCPLALLG